MFWDTLPGLVASWGAALSAVYWLATRLWRAWRRSHDFAHNLARLLELGDADQWPNGAETLPEAMKEIYRRQSETHDLVRKSLSESQALWIHHLEEWHRENR